MTFRCMVQCEIDSLACGLTYKLGQNRCIAAYIACLHFLSGDLLEKCFKSLFLLVWPRTGLCLWCLGKHTGQACSYCNMNYWSSTHCGPQLFLIKPQTPHPTRPHCQSHLFLLPLLLSPSGIAYCLPKLVVVVERFNTGPTILPSCRMFIDWVHKQAHLHGGVCGLPLRMDLTPGLCSSARIWQCKQTPQSLQ